jgi:hypothetical protein
MIFIYYGIIKYLYYFIEWAINIRILSLTGRVANVGVMNFGATK